MMQYYIPTIIANSNESNYCSIYTLVQEFTQKLPLAQGTITKVNSRISAGVTLTINDITGVFQGSVSGSNVTNRVISSKTTATLVVTSASGAFTVGETITGNYQISTAEVVTWTWYKYTDTKICF